MNVCYKQQLLLFTITVIQKNCYFDYTQGHCVIFVHYVFEHNWMTNLDDAGITKTYKLNNISVKQI